MSPSKRELIAFWQAQPDGEYTCSYCGRNGPKAYVQPQHPYYADGQEGIARRWECHNAAVRRAREERRTQLATMPRCELCRRRGTVRTYGVLLCGRHFASLRRAHGREMARNGFPLALFMTPDYSPDEVRRLASQP